MERGSSKCFFERGSDRTKATLTGIIQKWVLPETEVISDGWKGYTSLKKEGYVHLTVNHKKGFVDRKTGAHTNTIEGTWGLIKRQLRGKRRVSGQFNSYLAEYMWRRQHASDRHKLFFSFVAAIKQLYIPKSRDSVMPSPTMLAVPLLTRMMAAPHFLLILSELRPWLMIMMMI